MIMQWGVAGTSMALDPLGGAVCVMFFFPDGNGSLDLIDDSTAGAEGGIAVGCRDSNANGDVTDFKMSCAVNATHGDNIILSAYFCKDAITLLLCEGGEGLIFERGNFTTLMVITHPALKTGKTACRRVPYLITKCLRVNGLVG